MHIQCHPPVIFVRDIAASRRFYEGLLGQQVAIDMGINLSFTGGFARWQVDHAHEMIFGTPVDAAGPLGCQNFEFCFETDDLDAAFARVTAANAPCIQPPQEQPWGQCVFHVYDPDGHIVKVGELMTVVVTRFLVAGLSANDTARRTRMPLEMVREMAHATGNKV